jgi:cyclopropane-fatty-acyl-phospholipid synthase
MRDSTFDKAEPQSQLARGSDSTQVHRAAPDALPYRGEYLAATLLRRVFHRLPGSIAVRLWTVAVFQVGAAPLPNLADPPFVLVFRNPRVVCAIVLGRDPLRLADAYFRGDVDIEGDLFAALAIRDHLESLQMPIVSSLITLLTALRLLLVNPRRAPKTERHAPPRGQKVRAHSNDENREAIHFHYDVSNEFYSLWLDRAMVYSCGYFEQPDMSLDEAQQAKLEHICRKLLLKPGERFLDIGCGWGALVIYAAQKYGVIAHGITLSVNQLSVARRRIAEAGLEGRVSVELKDYRELQEVSAYDKIASVGMFEHVGIGNLPLYFSIVHRLLKPSGLVLNHGITHAQTGWNRNVSTRFINRYVFPDGELDSISNIQNVMERAWFEIADVEALRPHYALTLRAWAARLEQAHARALEFVSETTYRIWRLYIAACALEFESGGIGIYQVLASKRVAGSQKLPLTRRHLYDRLPDRS